MVDTKKKVKLSLDESRLLVLGAQILLGFQYRAFLESGFNLLPPFSQKLRLASLALMLLTILLLMWPIGFHEIVENGELSNRVLRFATAVMSAALLPFAGALGIDVFTMAQLVVEYRLALAASLGVALMALFFWYGWECSICMARQKRRIDMPTHEQETSNTSLHEKIDTVLTECRVVIPGSQALLGFQLIAILMEGFAGLPRSSQYLHLASLLMMALSTMLLMAPAAYHRIVERGEDSVQFWRFARTMLLTAMAALAAGLSSEFFVMARQVTRSLNISIVLAAGVALAFYALWFGYTLYRRQKRSG